MIEKLELLKEKDMVLKKAATKKTAAKVSAATKKSPAKTAARTATAPTGGTVAKTSAPIATDAPVASRVEDRPPDSAPIPASKAPGVIDDALIRSVMLGNKGKWGTGRDRDTRLAKEGYDVDEVRKAVRRARRSS